MNVQEIRQASRKEITSTITGYSYTIRKLSQFDIVEAQLNLMLTIKKEKAEELGLASKNGNHLLDVEEQRRQIHIERWVVQHGTVAPRIFFGSEEETPQDDATVHVNWIASDEAFLFSEIMSFAGINESATRALNDYLKNRIGSDSSTRSPELTASSPTK